MISKDWFKNWFNSHYYLLLYKHRDLEEARKFFHLIKHIVPIQKDWKILDFCCGYGRLSKILAEEGYHVTGVDLSDFLIEKAKENFKIQNLKGDFKICDIRDFKEVEKYNLALSFFTSFGYFSDEDNKKAFINLCSSVIKSGWIVFDYFNPDFVTKNLNEFEKSTFDTFDVIIRRNINNNRVNKIITIIKDAHTEEFAESIRIYTRGELVSLFEENNFIVKGIYGDYDGSTLLESSPRLIIFAQKL